MSVLTKSKCNDCGQAVSFEDGQRTEFCRCDPRCQRCSKQFMGKKEDVLCPECLDEVRHGEFQAQFPQLHDQIFARRQAYEDPEKIEKDLLEALDNDLQKQWRLR